MLALSLLVAPVLAGAAVGALIRIGCRGRLGGPVALLAGLLLPPLAALAAVLALPLIGIWDALLEGLLFGAGLVATLHRAFGDPRNLLLSAAAVVLGLLLLEIGVRTALPPPPGFPPGEPHFLLADAIGAARATQTWDTRSRELACSAIYGDRYEGLVDLSAEQDVQRPAQRPPRPSAARRVLHVGDSMVFGLGVDRGETFTAELERRGADVEHVNAGIPGLAPDGYLGVMEAWTAAQPFDAVVLYLYEGNDLKDLDGPYPCCGFGPLLDYYAGSARLRCREPTPAALTSASVEWLRYNSPPPYLLRVLLEYSSAAAYVSAALVSAGQRYSLSSTSSPAEREEHLGTILRTARDRLAARGIGFAVVVLPDRSWVESSSGRGHTADDLTAMARALGIATFDASPMVKTAAQGGADIFIDRPGDPHFNPAGHRLLAQWLQEQGALGHDSMPSSH